MRIFSVNLYTQNTFDFYVTIIDTDTETVFANVLLRGMENGTQRNTSVYLPLGMNYRITAAAVEGYDPPAAITGVVPETGGAAGELINHQGYALAITNTEEFEAHTTVIRTDTEETLYSGILQRWHQHNLIIPKSIAYRVIVDIDDSEQTTMEFTGVSEGSGRIIEIRLKRFAISYYNQEAYDAEVEIYRDDTNELIATKTAHAYTSSNLYDVYFNNPYSLRLRATIDDSNETVIEETVQTQDGYHTFNIRKQTYTLQLHHRENYRATYIVRNTDTEEVIKEVVLWSYDLDNIVLPLGINYSVELKPVPEIGLYSNTYLGVAEIPGAGGGYTQQVTLSYQNEGVALLYTGAYFQYVDQRPDVHFRVLKSADNTEVYSGVLTKQRSNIYLAVLSGFMAKVVFDEIPNYTIANPEVDVTVPASGLGVNVNLYYYFVVIQNNNAIDIPYRIVNEDTEEVIHEELLASSFATDYLPIRPGTNYRIDYLPVAGYTAPANETGIAGQNTYITKSPIYTADE